MSSTKNAGKCRPHLTKVAFFGSFFMAKNVESVSETMLVSKRYYRKLSQKFTVKIQIRTLTIHGEPWFVGKDVASVLGYAKPENAISNHVDLEDKTTTLIQGTGSNYKSQAVIINESGLYSLILSSKLPTAKHKNRTSKNFFSNPLTSLKISSII